MTSLYTITLDTLDHTSDILPGMKLSLRTNGWNQLSIAFKDFHVAYDAMAYTVQIVNNRSGQTLFKGISRNAEISFPAKSYHEAPMTFSDYISVFFTYDHYSFDYSAGDHTEKQILQDIFTAIGFSPSPIGAYVIDGVAVSHKFTDTSLDRIISDLAAINNRLWYWDGAQQLHYFASTGEAAPFGLSDTPNNTTTFPYVGFDIKKDYAADNSVTLGGSLICWKDGLWPGMAVQITNAHLGITAQTVIINEVEVELIKGDVGFQYTIHFGQAKKPRMTDYIIRSNQAASTIDQGLIPKCTNEANKYLSASGAWESVNSIATDSLWQAKGDLAVATGLHTAVRLPKGTDGLFLKANSATATGLEWATGAPHNQNEDWKLLKSSGGALLIDSATLKANLACDAGITIDGIDVSAHAVADTNVHGIGAYNFLTTSYWNINGGVPQLDGSALIPSARLGPSPSSSKYLRGDQTWQTLSLHTQNTDWILKDADGGSTLISSGALAEPLDISGPAGGLFAAVASGLYIGTGTRSSINVRFQIAANTQNILITNYLVAGATIQIDCDGELSLWSQSNAVRILSTIGLGLPQIASDPTTLLVQGLKYFNTTSKKERIYNGTAWADVSGAMSAHALDGTTYHSACTDITDFNASTSAHGLLKKLNNDATYFMNGQGNWAIPAAASSPASAVTDERTYGIAPIVGTSTNYARQDHTHGSPAAVSTSMSTFTTAQRADSTVYTNGSNIRVVVFYLRITNMTQIFSAYVNGTLAAQARVTSGSDGAGFTFVVGKGQEYYVVYGAGTQANFQWTEVDITNI